MITKFQRGVLRKMNDKKIRDLLGLFVIEGKKMFEEVLKSDLTFSEVFSTEPVEGSFYRLITPEEMAQISHLKTPTTLFATVRKEFPKLEDVDTSHNLVLALDCVQNPGNLGTILRIADWFGIRDVVCSLDCADCYSPKVVQATMGAIAHVRVHYTDLGEWLAAERAKGVPIYGTLLDGEPIYDAELSRRGVIVMGNEGRGISEACRQSLTHSLLIPSARDGHGESLNVGIATAIVCYEFSRKER